MLYGIENRIRGRHFQCLFFHWPRKFCQHCSANCHCKAQNHINFSQYFSFPCFCTHTLIMVGFIHIIFHFLSQFLNRPILGGIRFKTSISEVEINDIGLIERAFREKKMNFNRFHTVQNNIQSYLKLVLRSQCSKETTKCQKIFLLMIAIQRSNVSSFLFTSNEVNLTIEYRATSNNIWFIVTMATALQKIELMKCCALCFYQSQRTAITMAAKIANWLPASPLPLHSYRHTNTHNCTSCSLRLILN